MSSRNRQLVVLVVLVVAFAWLIGRQLSPSLGGAGSGAAPGRSATAGTADAAIAAVEVAELRLGALEHKPATYQPGRDLFRFAPRPRPQPPPPRPDPAAARRAPAARAAQQQQRQAAPPQPPRPQPPMIEFVYLGSFGLPGREIAVFSDGKQIFNAFAGEVLEQEFVVRSIGYESADIGFVNFPDTPPKRLAVGG